MLQQPDVAGKLILLPGAEDEGAAPLRRVVIGIGQTVAGLKIFRCDVWHESVIGPLAVENIVFDFGEQRRDVEIVAQCRAVQMVLLQPTLAFAMRTVGQHTHHVVHL